MRQERFEAAFWCPDLSTYALALDGAKQPCHALLQRRPGAALGPGEPGRAASAPASWTVTASRGHPHRRGDGSAPQPMSYHNGSVWPRDNALIALGFAHYGLSDHTSFGCSVPCSTPQATWICVACQGSVASGACGARDRRPTRSPARPRPGRCHSVRSPAGLSRPELRSGRRTVPLRQPRLPDFLDQVVIRNLEVGDSQFDIMLRRYGGDVSVNVLDRRGDGRIAITL